MSDHVPFRDDDPRYPEAFRAAWQHEFGLNFFSADHLASLFHRIAHPDDYRPPVGVKLPPHLDPEAWAKSMLHRFVDTLHSCNMPAAIDSLQRATTTSRALYPRTEAVVMLCYVYLVETGREAGREVTKKLLWDTVNERRKFYDHPERFSPLSESTRKRVLEKLGLENLPKGHWTKR